MNLIPAMARIGALATFVLTALLPIGARAAAADKDADSANNFHYTIAFGGFTRSYFVHVPKKETMDAQHPLPLVMMLHGAGGDGPQAAKQTGWDEKGDDEKFLTVFPDALPVDPRRPASFRLNPRVWQDGSGRANAARTEIDDLGFLGAVLDDVAKRYPVDNSRIYLAGFSNGASMTFYVCRSRLSVRIAAAAPVSGVFFDTITTTPVRYVPVLFIIGTADPLNPMDGGTARMPWGGSSVRPKVSATVNAWVRYTGCPATPIPLPDDGGGIHRLAYGPGKDGVEFVYVTIDGLGHHWPGSKNETLPDSIAGKTSKKLDATDAAWKFFSRHTLAIRAEAP